jgi:23S rRNA-/tRNA-specific pseudouridylate synthase
MRAREAPELRVAHRDGHLLVVVKPAGIATTSPDPSRATLASLARALDPRAPRMHPTSRLDRDVTGLVVFARTDEAIAALLEARRQGRYQRTYLAVCAGAPAGESGRWTWTIAIDPRDRTRRVALSEEEKGERAQRAASRWEVRGRAASASALALFPETGRTHQLRVHCAKAGHPILGDTSYGGPARVVLEGGRVVTPRRTLLHCARLSIPDLERGAMLELAEEVPEDVARTWAALGGDAEALSARR